MATQATARTPPLPRPTNLNPRPPTRILKTARPPPRGDTPRFELPGLAAFTGAPALPVPSLARDPLHRLVAGPSHSRSQTAGMAAAGTAHSKKRVAADVVDLTHTTTADVDDSESDEGPQTKRSRTSLSAKEQKRSKAKRAEQRAEKHDKLVAESAQWRSKYKKAFPTFTFYFDALDPHTEGSLSRAVERLGASVDNFFSKKVTHVVTSRPVPSAAAGKENQHSPSVSSMKATVAAGGMQDSAAGPMRNKKAPARSPTTYSLLNGQKLRPFGEGLDKNPFIDSQDILSKAVEFGLKIWHVEKIQAMLTRINSHSPKKADASTRPSLSLPSLLRDEQVYGTRERDPFVLRPDMHYFDRKSCYILVEDSTGEHRPIVTKEYERPRRHEDPSWPVLWGGVEGRGGFYHYEGTIIYERRVPPPVPVVPAATATAPAAKGGHALAAARAVGPAPNLRRALSMQAISKAGHRPAGGVDLAISGGKDTYIAASGNSQTITSTMATSTRSGAPSRLGGAGGVVDKRLAVLSQRTVPSMAGSSGKGGASKLVPGKLKRSVSVDAGLNARVPPPRDEPKKPGYCENCRIKYDDFKDHVVSSKHRRFAQNPKNWLELDGLLSTINRPLLADLHRDSPAHSSVVEGDSGFFEGTYDCDEEEEDEEEEDEEEEDVSEEEDVDEE